ncbi:GATOR1 complex protein NPRL2-like isoform X2 [Corticium candelabrum]|uniref:GATOR1 complex protein NPRL2-like isoform X2 n=1 Tax=Corticium candelabrum TaxID=121492 RepID=UPI002E267000|nr:GATOR1 complex protein NPRL2-like isoform X2 [Corticium candelabrum]
MGCAKQSSGAWPGACRNTDCDANCGVSTQSPTWTSVADGLCRSRRPLPPQSMTSNTVNLKILGCPQSIEDKKYKRNALLFNFGFVFDPDAKTTAFQPVIKKLSSCFRTLELESEFLSRDETRSRLPEILTAVLRELNDKGFCSIAVDEANTIHLKVIPDPTEMAVVCDHDVPIFCIDQAEIRSTPWDLTIKQILPYIDGFNHVLMIATLADVNVSLVQLCVQHLLHFGAIKLISVFQYSNMYMTTPKVSQLRDNRKLAAECLKFITKQGRPQPAIRDVFALYCALGPGVTVRDWCLRHEPQCLGISERLFIQFGLMKNLIVQLQKYPVLLSDEPNVKALKPYREMLTGKSSYDEICCHSGMSHQELDALIDSDPHLVVCWK